MYDEVAGLVTSVLDGYNVAIMAYGQTGSGKTFTMEGPEVGAGQCGLSGACRSDPVPNKPTPGTAYRYPCATSIQPWPSGLVAGGLR